MENYRGQILVPNKIKTLLESEIEMQKGKTGEKKIQELIKRKTIHTYAVLGSIQHILKKMNWKIPGTDNDWNLAQAQIIAVLHDLGRFEQAIKNGHYHELNGNNKFDHGLVGARKFITACWKDISLRQLLKNLNCAIDEIYLSIYFHGQYLPYEKYNSAYLKLIRDADKLANFPLVILDFLKEEKTTSKLNLKIWQDVLQGKQAKVNLVERGNLLSKLLYIFSWLFDINYEETKKILIAQKIPQNLIKLMGNYGLEEEKIASLRGLLCKHGYWN